MFILVVLKWVEYTLKKLGIFLWDYCCMCWWIELAKISPLSLQFSWYSINWDLNSADIFSQLRTSFKARYILYFTLSLSYAYSKIWDQRNFYFKLNFKCKANNLLIYRILSAVATLFRLIGLNLVNKVLKISSIDNRIKTHIIPLKQN